MSIHAARTRATRQRLNGWTLTYLPWQQGSTSQTSVTDGFLYSLAFAESLVGDGDPKLYFLVTHSSREPSRAYRVDRLA